ncbi:MAG: nitrilase family protein [Paludibacteraceae bacterium]|nr:nitrilase family protein [Paludibacteraceae bacterium]
MRVALLQYPIVWADTVANLQTTVSRLHEIKGQADVAVLPEMFTTGFATNRPDLAEEIDGITITTLQQTANECDLMIVGSFICKEGDKLYNRGFFIKPGGEAVFVDKRHLYAHGGENTFFTAGTTKPIVEYKGVRFRLAICYDLRFPVWLRQDKNDLYDILLVSANWPQCRIAYWDILVPARAIENQCYIAAVNPIGEDDKGLHYNGHSVAYDSHLKPLVHFADDEEGTKIADFDIEALHHFREVLPLYRDAD